MQNDMYSIPRQYKKHATGSRTSVIPVQRARPASVKPEVASPIKRARSKKAGSIMLVTCVLVAVIAVLLVPMLVNGETAPPIISAAAMDAADVGQVITYNSLAEAQAVLPFEASLPTALPEGTVMTAVRVVGDAVLEVEYLLGKATIVFRTAQGRDDISENAKNFVFTITEEVNGVARCYSGITEKVLHLAVWAANDQTFAISTDAGIDAAIMRSMAESVA